MASTLSQIFSGWYSEASVAARFTQNDMNTLKSIGFTCVRLPVTDVILFNSSASDPFMTSYLTLIDNTVQKILNAKLAVIFGLLQFYFIFSRLALRLLILNIKRTLI
jgi:hypothetical protein